MPYNCNICNKQFISNSGFWKHNKKYHQSIHNIQVSQSKPEVSQSKPEVSQSKPEVSQSKLDVFIKNKCKFCNKILSCKQSKYKHEKICANKNNEINELQILKNEIINIFQRNICLH
jgi:hypothetical protein